MEEKSIYTNDARYAVQTMDTVQDRLKTLKRSCGTWRKVSAVFDGKIPAGTLCMIAKGREPMNPKHRALLGLPLVGEVPLCLECGEAHPLEVCPKNHEVKITVGQGAGVQVVEKRTRPRTRWAEYSPAELRAALENRYELPPLESDALYRLLYKPDPMEGN